MNKIENIRMGNNNKEKPSTREIYLAETMV
jgi:hypothetical protein